MGPVIPWRPRVKVGERYSDDIADAQQSLLHMTNDSHTVVAGGGRPPRTLPRSALQAVVASPSPP